jgi:malic enzyme
VQAVMARWPNAVLQFEDFSMEHALLLLERYRRHHLVFNDDIQVRWLLGRVGSD